jgi:CRISPR-associated protein Cmr1
MLERCFEMKFLTPAFLGDAEQKGVWRTPPIKALLRQWWRVAYAAQHDFPVSVDTMRKAEGLLFGYTDGDTTNDCSAARRSAVRLRLDKWDAGALTTWGNARPQNVNMPKITHPEVKAPVGSDLYLGFGPLVYKAGATNLKSSAAIQAGESALLRLAWSENSDQDHLLDKALWLMDRFGTLGGRSRNGWGSFSLMPQKRATLQGKLPLRKWEKCLQLDWPHAIGKDGNGALIWQTESFDDWKQAMTALAKLKIALRTQKFPYTTNNDRNWLAQPVTHHTGGNLRLPNSLRFKLRPTQDGKLVGVIFHVPCLPPKQFSPEKQAESIGKVWQKVHQFLDDPQASLTRILE